MTSRRHRSHLGFCFAGAFTLLSAAGCSFFYELNTTQCEVKSDCTALGPQFADTECINRVCVPKSTASGGASSQGGQSGLGGAKTSGGTPGVGGSSDAGAGGQPECSTNADCIAAHVDQPFVCNGGSCVQLTNDACPVLIPSNKTLEYLRKGSPVVLGGFASMTNAQDPHDTQAIINWDLAFDELNTSTFGGLPGTNGETRPVLGLICQGKTTDVSAAMTHLTQAVGVPAILSTLSADNLFAAWNFTRAASYTSAGGTPVFFMSTGSADLRLANLKDDGLMWHMLGSPRVLAGTTASLIKRIEGYVNEQRKACYNGGAGPCTEDPATVPLRITLVTSDDPTMTDIGSVLTTDDVEHPETLLSFNGAAAIDSGNRNNFRQVAIESVKYHTNPVVSGAIEDIEGHPPHIVIAMATAEFSKVASAVETYWSKGATAGMMRPYFVMSHFLYNTAEMLSVAGVFASKSPPLDERILGVNYAQAQDDHSKRIYNSYQSRLQQFYSGALPIEGTENYYDGAYSLLYSVAAAYAARSTPTGNNVRDGLEDRVFSTSSDAAAVDVGPSAVGGAIGKLNGDFTYKMSLWGAMGAPDFDRGSGTRVSATSVWCLQQNAAKSAYEYQSDGLIYDPKTQTFSAPADGAPQCLEAY